MSNAQLCPSIVCRFSTRGKVHTESWRPRDNYLHERFLGLHTFTRKLSGTAHFYIDGKFQHTSLPWVHRWQGSAHSLPWVHEVHKVHELQKTHGPEKSPPRLHAIFKSFTSFILGNSHHLHTYYKFYHFKNILN